MSDGMRGENRHLPAQSIHSFSDALEHDKTQGYSNNGIAHCKQLSPAGGWRRVSIACKIGEILVSYAILI